MIYGLIIAAGKQSRFETSTPKALMSFDTRTLLDINVDNMRTVCDEVYVVTSTENTKYFEGKYPELVINSGFGCGDAVMRALTLLNLDDADTVFIQWGDCLHKPHIYNDVVNNYTGKCLIPCVFEDTPYVQIIPKDNFAIEVKFSKYDEKITAGFHDLSLFYCNAKQLQKALTEFAHSIASTSKDNLYSHKHGNEMQFLDVFNETSLQGEIIEYTDYNVFAFNTLTEFNNLIS